ncbi:type II toxin-antitoxin system RelB/DinJ family antitoxin [Lactobacillus xujianguonis]|uniref:type II toxin-antitoxin system RelB/DinJ family antitoxin n=1 Tax=Lactobacillus xujianguonis TaxID=2495899 RepID=UPI00143D8FDC|nr:type II toxin-antitoxin system RelB/DinJ family antitoxin [Lactobacillus xujianguonis]
MKQIIKKIISVTLKSDLVSAVKRSLAKIGLTQRTFINGFMHFIANNRFLPFKKLTKTEEETANKLATIQALKANECEYDKSKMIQKAVDETIYEKAMTVLKNCQLTLSHAIRMLYEKFVLTGKMPYQFEVTATAVDM